MSSQASPASSPAKPRKRRPYAPRVPIEERREQLLDAALAVIVDAGHDRVSVDAVAKRAGVARAVVYSAYGDLGALLGALLDRTQAHAFDRLLAAVPEGEGLRDPAGYAAEAARRAAAMLAEDPDTWRLILLTPATMTAVVHERIEGERERLRLRAAEWIARVQRTRSAAPGLDPRVLDPQVLAHALVAAGEHFGRVALTDPDRFDPEHLAGQFRALLGALWPPA
ncbi:helix-turn-helix transcriptional regulator [Streptomyces sp. NA04227]|uniref:TetR/AcrR family transcriptional regulator n=1 Tax=Streptomyces sp. NA04227 TaxID=2742136 RepID=UPI001591FBAE|nr:helix-turn-helix domain-containing protein [Streptomyces sp. NA04227]QKW07131.1 helix-turn-helix transcriptional regulator [Streptomyces sp. NA04227]